jgi:hypothetical protein
MSILFPCSSFAIDLDDLLKKCQSPSDEKRGKDHKGLPQEPGRVRAKAANKDYGSMGEIDYLGTDIDDMNPQGQKSIDATHNDSSNDELYGIFNTHVLFVRSSA